MNIVPPITASIVTYQTNAEQLLRAAGSFLQSSLASRLYILDNSPDDRLKKVLETLPQNFPHREKLEYIYNAGNLGFGRAHNLGMKKSLAAKAAYHLVLNPDVWFAAGNLEKIFAYMQKNPDIGQLMPGVFYPDGRQQYLCKLLPTPLDLLVRRFLPVKSIRQKLDQRYELRKSGYQTIMSVPNLSGCFMFLRREALENCGLFDENFFMYLEDTDLCRRIGRKYKTVYFPEASISHDYGRGSYKTVKLLYYHIRSAFYYFSKWGWFIDPERKIINQKTLQFIYRQISK